MLEDSAMIVQLLRTARTIAVVGLSADSSRPSHTVASYLKEQGYRVIPINPQVNQVLGEKSYPNLLAVPEQIDIVDVFRRSESVSEIVDEAIKIGAKAIWMQLGVINETAAAKARHAGLSVVMDRCLKVEYAQLKTAGLL